MTSVFLSHTHNTLDVYCLCIKIYRLPGTQKTEQELNLCDEFPCSPDQEKEGTQGPCRLSPAKVGQGSRKISICQRDRECTSLHHLRDIPIKIVPGSRTQPQKPTKMITSKVTTNNKTTQENLERQQINLSTKKDITPSFQT